MCAVCILLSCLRERCSCSCGVGGERFVVVVVVVVVVVIVVVVEHKNAAGCSYLRLALLVGYSAWSCAQTQSCGC